MTTTLIIERKNPRSCLFPFQETQSLPKRKSYYRFYQLKLRQLLAESQSDEEKNAKYLKQNQPKTPLGPKRSNIDYTSHITEAMKIQSQNINLGTRSSSLLSVRQQRKKDAITCTITSTNTTITELRPKSILKTNQSPSSMQRQRTLSASPKKPKPPHKKVGTKTITNEMDHTDEDVHDDHLSKSNACAYTEVSSSTSQNVTYSTDQNAHQSVLKTMLLHFNSNTPSEMPKWNLYRDFNEKFCASISPTVYRNFERIIL
ncbi:unnamed protein product [Rotaria magnacalcarata]|uniref:Uncharacterized protein n=5 Tax=Rotaria magnacalcarata TaxID=392030 RepID=A0A816VT78_9BILA|nr:unnamed protein product [Rotaria magnacalcarata]CAF2126602.1 unnamed protein product [Rotaria magnacalcarata]CAF4136645.1 unnamed protein product [Rotaria magnacalcarata]